MVLIQFALALELRDFDLDADDPADLFRQVVRRRIAHLPGVRLRGLLLVRQACNDAARDPGIVMDADPTVRMYDLVVPGGNPPVRLVLARVPVRRYVPLRAAEDHERRRAIGDRGPDRVRASDALVRR